MKQLNLLVIFIFSFYGNLMAQNKDISGRYVHTKYRHSIEIKGKHFIYALNQHYPAIYYKDTLANCTWDWVDKDFILIKSESPSDIVFSSMKVQQYSNSNVQDSITINFHVPYDRGMLGIRIYDDKYRVYKYECYPQKCCIKIPKDIKRFSFDIRPEVLPEESNGKFYGITCLNSIVEFEVVKGVTVMDFDIPNLTNSFFEQYYVVDEFVRVHGNCIFWKGEVYKKEH